MSAELLSKNLQMEQDTSNNLMVTVEAQQQKIEQLEIKREQFITKLRGRDELIA